MDKRRIDRSEFHLWRRWQHEIRRGQFDLGILHVSRVSAQHNFLHISASKIFKTFKLQYDVQTDTKRQEFSKKNYSTLPHQSCLWIHAVHHHICSHSLSCPPCCRHWRFLVIITNHGSYTLVPLLDSQLTSEL